MAKSLVVKFGGSCLSTPQNINLAAKKVVENHAKALVNSEDLRTIMAFIGGGQIRKDVIRKLKRR